MDIVHAFNNELSSLYNIKPPISKAKMTQITKSAIKGIKLYKHIVQSVEKFIQKCRPEYKVPGLYVVDSIVRQSRHQFGADRDVFAPRFARNISVTFQHLFKCPEEERPKIVRVLNLWQKNQVFPIELIQPLLDLAVSNAQPSQQVMTPPEPPKSYQDTSWGSWGQENHASSAGIDPQLLLQHLAAADNSTPTAESVKFDKKLLDFDYGDEEEEEEEVKRPQAIETNALALSMAQNLLNNPDLLRQLQQMNFQQPLATAPEPLPPMAVPPSPDKSSAVGYPGEPSKMELYNSALPPPYMPGPPPPTAPMMPPPEDAYPRMDIPVPPTFALPSEEVMEEAPQVYVKQDFPPQDLDERILPQVAPPESQEREKSSMERDRSRSPRGSRRSGRRHRSRSPRFKRGRSRSRSRRRHSRSRSRERERERKHRGLLPLKKSHLSVYSTTLWLGHLSKLASEADLSDAFGEFGTILSIDMIPPRGCAFICMSRRQDALRALQKLKNLKLHGSIIKMAWAPGKGVKEKEYRDYWDVDTGVSHIPYEKLNKDTLDLDALEEGGMVDEESAPEFIRDMLQKKRESGRVVSSNPPPAVVVESQPVVPQQPAEPAPLITPAVPPPPVVPSHISMLTMPPFGMHVPPGMMPPPQHMVIPMGVPPPNPMMMVMPPPPYLPPTAASPESSHAEEVKDYSPFMPPPPMEYPPAPNMQEPPVPQEPPANYQSYSEPEHIEPPKPKSRALLPDPILDQNGLPIVPSQGLHRDNFHGGFNHHEGYPPRGDYHHRDYHPPPPHDNFHPPPPMDGFPPAQDNFYPRDNFGPPPPRGRGFGPPRGGGFFPPPHFHRDRDFHPRGFPRGMRVPRGRPPFFHRGGFRGRRGGGNWDPPMWEGPQEAQEWEEYLPPHEEQEHDQDMGEPVDDPDNQECVGATTEFNEPPEADIIPKEEVEEEEPKEIIPRNSRRRNTRWNMEPMADDQPMPTTNGPSTEVPPTTMENIEHIEYHPPSEEAAAS